MKKKNRNLFLLLMLMTVIWLGTVYTSWSERRIHYTDSAGIEKN